MSKTMPLKPRMSEKSYALSQAENTFVFDVPAHANKMEVADAVKLQFNVTVRDVRVAVIKGKPKASIRKRNRNIIGSRADIKKAYVSLKEGDSIPIFAAIEEEEKAEQKDAEKAAKKAKKEAKK